jgi:hypothetical protein
MTENFVAAVDDYLEQVKQLSQANLADLIGSLRIVHARVIDIEVVITGVDQVLDRHHLTDKGRRRLTHN